MDSSKQCGKPENYDPSQSIPTSELYRTLNLPQRFEFPYMFYGYGCQVKHCENPLYRTSTSEYGWYTPSPHTVAPRYFPRTNSFTDHLAKCGMYRNYSLNTSMDKSFY